ncbi:MAG: glycosyltransferase family 39 protein [Polyangiaceae bacterium]
MSAPDEKDDAKPEASPAEATDSAAPEPAKLETSDAIGEDAKAPQAAASAPVTRTASKQSLSFDLKGPIGPADHVVGAVLGLLYLGWLLSTARGLGFARDEGFYFHAASTYAGWFERLMEQGRAAMQQNVVDGYWGTNHEHPSLMKGLFAISWMVLHKKWHVFADASTAFRFPGMAMGGLAIWVTYLFGARAFSRPAGVVAAVLLGLMPHLFYNAHLACFDVPIVAMWLLSVYVYWRSAEEGSVGWAIAAGVVYGLTLETKHNAWILPLVFVPHAAFTYARGFLGGKKPASAIPWNLVSMSTLGPLVFYALWPWMWFDTKPRIDEYVNFHVHHEYYNMEFLGRNYFGPPSPPLYAPVLVLASVPTVTILLFLLGGGERIKTSLARVTAFFRDKAAFLAAPDGRGPDGATDLLIGLAFAGPLAVFFLPTTPIFGGTKHWMPAYPFLALLAGRGFDLARAAMDTWLAEKRPDWREAAPWALGVAAIVGPLAITKHSHPFGLSTYVPLVGGTAGGADLGLNRQFWGYTTESVGPWLEANAPQRAAVFIHDTSWPSWERLIAEKRIRPDLRGVGSPSEAQIALVHHELHMNEVDYSIWIAYQTVAPAFILRHDGVPIVSVYSRAARR